MNSEKLLLIWFVFFISGNIASAANAVVPPNVHIVKDYGSETQGSEFNRSVSQYITSCSYTYPIYADNHTDIQTTLLVDFTKAVGCIDSSLTISRGTADIKFFTKDKPKLVVINNGQITVKDIVKKADVVSDNGNTWPLLKQAFTNAVSADEAYIAMPMKNGNVAWIFIPKDILEIWNNMTTNKIDYTLD